MNNKKQILPIPAHFDPAKVESVFRVNYQALATSAEQYAKDHNISAAATDKTKICLLVIDAQNSFCLPDFELFVGGQSGRGAIDDNIRLCKFIYSNLQLINCIYPTMDTHTAMQIFHPIFWVNEKGEHPVPAATMITLDDVKNGVWKVNPAVAASLGANYMALQRHTLHYCETLTKSGKYALTVWPYHTMLGGIGHALVSSVEEALFFHNIARFAQTGFEIKGGNPLTENYSVLAPEVLTGPDNVVIAQRNTKFIQKLLTHDYVIIAGQAKSHCVAWTIEDLLNQINVNDPKLAQKVYLLEDCTSPVVIPGVIDFTPQANEAFAKFAAAGMHVVNSTTPIWEWPGVTL